MMYQWFKCVTGKHREPQPWYPWDCDGRVLAGICPHCKMILVKELTPEEWEEYLKTIPPVPYSTS